MDYALARALKCGLLRSQQQELSANTEAPLGIVSAGIAMMTAIPSRSSTSERAQNLMAVNVPAKQWSPKVNFCARMA